MICFRDRSFCSSSAECANERCSRNFTDRLREEAVRWWGGNSPPPIAWQDFRALDCGFRPKQAADAPKIAREA